MMEVSISTAATTSHLGDAGQQHRFHAIWLRDNAWDAETRSSGNGQRLIALRDVSPETRIAKAEIRGASLHVTFAQKTRPSSTHSPGCWITPMTTHSLRNQVGQRTKLRPGTAL